MNADLHDAALSLVTSCRLVPLLPRSKRPRHDDWQNQPITTPEQADEHWSLYRRDNIGVLGGNGLAIVDLDPDKGGQASLDALEQQHGPLPTTSTVVSGSGGRHFWFTTTGELASWNPGPGLEVRARGRQTAAPPSVHPTGARYAWADRAPLAVLPAWLVKPERPRPSENRAPSPLTDPVLDVAPTVYVPVLTGLEPDAAGFIVCPLHGDTDPSLKVYDDAARGWFCFGCERGGTVVDLAAALAGITGPIRGRTFLGILDYLRGRLG